ncbi:EF-hand calcium-binding domain-containing protein 5, partial [Frankliniella fusca]
AECYKKILEEGVLGPYDLTATLNTDGCRSTKGATKETFPVFLRIDEFPPHLRQKFMLLAAVYSDKEQPVMNTLLLPVVEELNKLSSRGVLRPTEGQQVESKLIVKCFCVDGKARGQVLNMDTHQSYNGCTYCDIRGVLVEDPDTKKRTMRWPAYSDHPVPLFTARERGPQRGLKVPDDADGTTRSPISERGPRRVLKVPDDEPRGPRSVDKVPGGYLRSPISEQGSQRRLKVPDDEDGTTRSPISERGPRRVLKVPDDEPRGPRSVDKVPGGYLRSPISEQGPQRGLKVPDDEDGTTRSPISGQSPRRVLKVPDDEPRGPRSVDKVPGGYLRSPISEQGPQRGLKVPDDEDGSIRSPISAREFSTENRVPLWRRVPEIRGRTTTYRELRAKDTFTFWRPK